MKEKDALYDNLLDAIRKKNPQNAKLTNLLVSTLSIEKEAVYRRLRGEVPFTFSEIVVISKELGLSLDDIIGATSIRSRPFQLKITEHINPLESGYTMMEQVVNILKVAREHPEAEGGEATNALPQPIYLPHKYLSRFYLFKWKYLYGDSGQILPFQSIDIPEKLQMLQEENVIVSQQISNTCYIWDNLIFYYLINDISYFAGIQLITKEEVGLLKNDLLNLLDQVEQMATTGRFTATGNKVQVYISNINFDTSYCYLVTPNFHLSMIKAFTLNTVASLDNETYGKLRNWVQSLKRLSTLISESGEKERVLFFEKQRKLVNLM